MRSRTLWTSSRPARKSAHSLALLPRQAQSFLPKSGAIPTTTSTMRFKFGDVVLVPFPFTNQAASKKRPAVVVSSHAYNMVKADVVLMAITSQARPFPTSDEIYVQGWQAAGLLKPSVIKPVFATIEQSLVIRQLGALDAADQERCDMRLRALSDDDHITTKHTGRMNDEFNGLSRCSVRSCN